MGVLIDRPCDEKYLFIIAFNFFGDILVVRKRVLKSVGRVKPVGARTFPKEVASDEALHLWECPTRPPF
jgi:hypothetical protein